MKSRAKAANQKRKETPHLTPRQREVKEWLTAGKTLEEIGLILGISRRTAEKHRDAIYSKLGVANRLELFQRGLVLACLGHPIWVFH